MYINLLGAEAIPEWIAVSFPIIRIVLAVIIVLMCLALIVTVIIQPSASGNGVNPITGQSETYYGKNKSYTLEGFLRKLTVILAIAIAVTAVLFFLTLIISGRQVA